VDDRLRDLEAMFSLNKAGDFRLEEKVGLIKNDLEKVKANISTTQVAK
jgi:hypothetical protein